MLSRLTLLTQSTVITVIPAVCVMST